MINVSKLTTIDFLYLLLPMISGYTMAMFCKPNKSSGQVVKFRPPAWVFGIVWPILYILLGIAWVNSKQLSLLYFILILFLNLWLYVYACRENKIGGVFVIFLSILSLLYIFVSVSKTIKYYLVPLLVWLLFAGLINIVEVQKL
tara:strand:+ start:2525 stop:2956 length:432 start_codon:yes stop_codon:yes gene_type:complete